MKISTSAKIIQLDHRTQSSVHQFALDVLIGLSKKNKRLPSKYFYDAQGSELFKKITDLEEYYPTRVEHEILFTYRDKLKEYLEKKPFNFLEFGSGDGRKTKVLLKHFVEKGLDFEYFPLDISRSSLEELLGNLERELPTLKATGLSGEYFEGIKTLNKLNENPKFILFLGSNIGNFNPAEARNFMLNLWKSLSHGDMALIGFDMVKDERVLNLAYNDPQGITSQFNLNLLERINGELNGDFDISSFRHYAHYDPVKMKMKSFILSKKSQSVYLRKLQKRFEFNLMEPIFTESSYKYSEKKIAKLANNSGFKILETLTDERGYFSDVLIKCVK